MSEVLTRLRRVTSGQQAVPTHVQDLLGPFLERQEVLENRRVSGVPDRMHCGLDDLDEDTGGLRAGDVVVLAARPAMGCTTLALQIAAYASLNQPRPVLFRSHREPPDELVLRAVAAQGPVDVRRLRRGGLDEQGWDVFARTLGRLSSAPLWFDSGSTPADAALAVVDPPHLPLTESAAQRRAPLLVVDAAPEMREPSETPAGAELLRSLAALAIERELIVLVTVGLPLPAHPDGPEPGLADLATFPTAERVATHVLTLQRPDAYAVGHRLHPRAGEADLHLVKNARGITGTTRLAYLGWQCRFVSWPSGSEDSTGRTACTSDVVAPLEAALDRLGCSRAEDPIVHGTPRSADH